MAAKTLVWTLRLVVGGVFVASGLAKCFDPLGSFYKFEEYVNVFSLTALRGCELTAAFAVPAIELVLGVLLLLGCCRRGVPLLLLVLMGVMMPLTWMLATTDAMRDCGCFGDAWQLSNWQTFYKNVALTAALVALLFLNRRVPGIYGPAVQWVVMVLTLFTGLTISLNGYIHQPLVDFRPFKVGTRLVAPEMADTDEADYVFIYRNNKTGNTKEFSIDNAPDEGKEWTFVERQAKTKPPTPAQVAAAHPMAIFDNGVEATAEVLDSTRCQLLVLIPDLNGMNMAFAKSINALNLYAEKYNCAMAVVAAASTDEIDKWSDIALPNFKLYTGDDSELKTIARGNPAILCIDNGTIKWKSTLASIPKQRFEGTATTPPQQLGIKFNPKVRLGEILFTYLILMALLLLLNRFYPVTKFAVMAFTRGRKGKSQSHENELDEALVATEQTGADDEEQVSENARQQ